MVAIGKGGPVSLDFISMLEKRYHSRGLHYEQPATDGDFDGMCARRHLGGLEEHER
jgi:hypothetical protein